MLQPRFSSPPSPCCSSAASAAATAAAAAGSHLSLSFVVALLICCINCAAEYEHADDVCMAKNAPVTLPPSLPPPPMANWNRLFSCAHVTQSCSWGCCGQRQWASSEMNGPASSQSKQRSLFLNFAAFCCSFSCSAFTSSCYSRCAPMKILFLLPAEKNLCRLISSAPTLLVPSGHFTTVLSQSSNIQVGGGFFREFPFFPPLPIICMLQQLCELWLLV